MPDTIDKTLQGPVSLAAVKLRAANDERIAANAANSTAPDYAELFCLTHFSFQRGASHPHELVQRAAELGYTALAITDEASVAGVARALQAHRDWMQKAALPAEQRPTEPPTEPPALRLLWGASFELPAGTLGTLSPLACTLVALARDTAGWGGLCQFITATRRAAPKGCYHMPAATDAAWALLAGCECIVVLHRGQRAANASASVGTAAVVADDPLAIRPFTDAIDLIAACATVTALAAVLLRKPSHLWLGVQALRTADDAAWHSALQQVAATTGAQRVAVGGVVMHQRSRKPLLDVINAVRVGRPLHACGQALHANAERHLRPRRQLAELFDADALAATVALADRCRFDPADIRYRYPSESVLPGLTPMQTLRQLTAEGAAQRYPAGVPAGVLKLIEHEMTLIDELGFAMYFLTVHDIVRFARQRGILCQGRGSAANSAVCYCLHITEVNPDQHSLLFERFISRARREPPDIDVDFEHQRREEVIQYIYAKYGRDRAALAAVVVRYRTRSALRDVGMALAVPPELIDAFAKDHHWFDRQVGTDRLPKLLAELGLATADGQGAITVPADLQRQITQWMELTLLLRGTPRHLSQHVGGFVLTEGPLTQLVPVENAAMPDRSVIQWDKEDLESTGLMKVDVLALGMLSALRHMLVLAGQKQLGSDPNCLALAPSSQPWRLQDIPREDPAVYDMCCQADTVGVFQIESRAQMSMLPRLKPRNFYDLVVEVALVRPGPIQGGMVHPYLQRRLNPQLVHYPSPELQEALGRTLGVPIFQEQVMQVAILAAGFSPDEADRLRRSMAAWKMHGDVKPFYDRLVGGMVARGYQLEFAETIFKQMQGFGEYGFPESHSASFAVLVYFSAWFKRHHPDVFLCGLLNAQPMGFYSPSQLVQDAQRHGVQVRPVCVQRSHWQTLPEAPKQLGSDPNFHLAPDVPWPKQLGSDPNYFGVPVRLGLQLVAGLGAAVGQRIVAARGQGAFVDVDDLARRASLGKPEVQLLAAADALAALVGHRRQQMWAAAGTQRHVADMLAALDLPAEAAPDLIAAPEGEAVVFDYAATGLTLRRHPLAILRPRLARRGARTAAQLAHLGAGHIVHACGLVNVRQRPSTAKGTTFVTLEDESGSVNIIVWAQVAADHRDALLHARLLWCQGRWEHGTAEHGDADGRVRHLIAQRLVDVSAWLGRLLDAGLSSRNFH